MTRGIRNNNPLNIRRTATKWKGQRPEQTDPHFVQFTAMEWGIRAAFCLLDTYADKYGLRSVEQIVSRWAPPSENNTESYIAHVCRMTGFTPTQPLERCHWPRLLWAMAKVETGHTLPMETIMKGLEMTLPTPSQGRGVYSYELRAMSNEQKRLKDAMPKANSRGFLNPWKEREESKIRLQRRDAQRANSRGLLSPWKQEEE